MSEARRGIHQFVPILVPHDATGNHTLLLQESLRDAGWRSEIFVEAVGPETQHITRPYLEYPEVASGSDVLIYQLSTRSPIADFLMGRSESVVVNYHNLTPRQLFERWDAEIVAQVDLGRRQLRKLASRTTLAIADSRFNAEELERVGYERVEVVPVLFDAQRSRDRGPAAGEPAAGEPAEGARWLFVGRLVPPKCQHRLVMALWAYRRFYDPNATLDLVGSGGYDRYVDALRSFISCMGLDGAVRIITDADDPRLAQLYGASDVFVSLSEHEGFGIPLVEAMVAGVPLVALNAGAVPDTVGGAGVVVDRSDPLLVAAAVHRVLDDTSLRDQLVASGAGQARLFALERTRRLALEALTKVAEDAYTAGTTTGTTTAA